MVYLFVGYFVLWALTFGYLYMLGKSKCSATWRTFFRNVWPSLLPRNRRDASRTKDLKNCEI